MAVQKGAALLVFILIPVIYLILCRLRALTVRCKNFRALRQLSRSKSGAQSKRILTSNLNMSNQLLRLQKKMPLSVVKSCQVKARKFPARMSRNSSTSGTPAQTPRHHSPPRHYLLNMVRWNTIAQFQTTTKRMTTAAWTSPSTSQTGTASGTTSERSPAHRLPPTPKLFLLQHRLPPT